MSDSAAVVSQLYYQVTFSLLSNESKPPDRDGRKEGGQSSVGAQTLLVTHGARQVFDLFFMVWGLGLRGVNLSGSWQNCFH